MRPGAKLGLRLGALILQKLDPSLTLIEERLRECSRLSEPGGAEIR